MDAKKMKTVAEWLYSGVFRDEPIPRGAARGRERLPAMLQTARSLENGRHQSWQSREVIFMKQGKLLAGYEDDYEFSGSAQYYYPTYAALSDQELRGYFSWRTGLRRGDVRKTSLSFAFLYIYELLNQIGTADPEDGYRRLADFRDIYGPLDGGVLPYLGRWLRDYVVYYGLDPALLSDETERERSIAVLDHIEERDPEEIARAVEQLAPKWLRRSRFYADCREDMDTVIVRVLRRISAHYASRCKKTMVEQYFGAIGEHQLRLFEAAVFCDPLKRRRYEYAVGEQCVYRCKNGLWTVRERSHPPSPDDKMGQLLKTIDSVMREECGYRHPVMPAIDTKWVLQIIRKEVRGFLAEKKAAEEKRVSIDYTQLTRIRRDAGITQEKLMVDEEADAEKPERVSPPEEPAGPENLPLSPPEARLLRCLLYGGDTGWVQAEGHLLSVLADGINEKLYDTFQDSVLDDIPRPIGDYIDELKEMVRP